MSNQRETPSPNRGRERRREPRINVQAQLAIYVLSEPKLHARLYDFSAGGFSIACSKALAPGTVHRVLIASRRTPADVLTGRVAYCRERPADSDGLTFQAGFAFVEVDDLSRQLINALLDELAAVVDASGGSGNQ